MLDEPQVPPSRFAGQTSQPIMSADAAIAADAATKLAVVDGEVPAAAAAAAAEGAPPKPAAVYPPLSSLDPSRCDELQCSVRALTLVWREACAPLLVPVRGSRRTALLQPLMDNSTIWNTFVAAMP